MSWQLKAQQRLQENANKCMSEWGQTKAGQKWREKYSRRPPTLNKRVHPTLAQNSPYAHGFSLPDYHHDLIEALNHDDEVEAKAIMLRHFV